MSCHQVVEAMEDLADGRVSLARRNAARHFGDYIAWAAEADTFDPATRPPDAELHYSLWGVVGATTNDDDELLRQIEYSQEPFGPQEFAPSGYKRRRSISEHQDQICRTIREIINPFRSRSPEVAELHGDYRLWARCIYESREVRFMGRMADLLAETITDDQELLTHLRSGGPHFRGCWAIDELLGLA
ncbi:hypothetical protein [Paludisphaera sp.]|uniref:hypothetical protein n=1 Tax=Paludisphaera sp. TaxID=2017432 RepID=UPI00301C481A